MGWVFIPTVNSNMGGVIFERADKYQEEKGNTIQYMYNDEDKPLKAVIKLSNYVEVTIILSLIHI